MPDGDLVPIGTFARTARVTVRALRHYHAIDVLVPARVDPGSGYRYYRWSQLIEVLGIKTLRDLGVPLEEVRAHLVGGEPLTAMLAIERTRLERQAARAARAIAVIDQLADATGLPAYAAEAVVLPASATLTVTGAAHGDTLGADAGALISHLLRSAEDAGADTTTPVIGEYPVSLDGPLTIRAHLPVAVPLEAGTTEATGVQPSVFVGGPHAKVVHTGPIDSLPLAYHGLLEWLYTSGHRVDGPFLERYLDDPSTTDPAALRTEVLHAVPAEPAAAGTTPELRRF